MPSRLTSFVPFLWTLSLLAVALAACNPATPIPAPTETATVSPLPTKTPVATPTVTPTPIRTPPALVAVYQTSLLNQLDTPHTYIQEPCQLLHDKWSSTNSAPGTVVMTIMFHSITRDAVTSSDQISEYYLRQLMNSLHDKGFQAITTTQLLEFMETNAKIPELSVLLVVDDRKQSVYYTTWFQEYWDEWGWPVVNAWISTDLSSADLWQQQVDLENKGWVDHQAHGVIHNTPMWPGASDAYITNELQGSIDAFKLHFNKTPIAIIWPGGGFSPRSVEIARQLGYRLGFTTSPRGPLMFNWVPLSDTNDPQRPFWVPEGSVQDPLLVLPRYWDTDAILHINDVIQVGQEAAVYAEQNKATELEYYDIVCASQYGSIP
jgi:hypothetical protein